MLNGQMGCGVWYSLLPVLTCNFSSAWGMRHAMDLSGQSARYAGRLRASSIRARRARAMAEGRCPVEQCEQNALSAQTQRAAAYVLLHMHAYA